MEDIILGLPSYFFAVNFLSKKKRAMCCGMNKPCGLKFRQYAVRLIGINEYFSLFPGSTLSDKIGINELNEIFLNSIYNIYLEQVSVCAGF